MREEAFGKLDGNLSSSRALIDQQSPHPKDVRARFHMWASCKSSDRLGRWR